MSDFPIKTQRMSFYCQNNGENRYLHFTTFKKKLETLTLLSNLLLVCRMWHPMSIGETQATVILSRGFFIYEISSYPSFYYGIILIFCDIVCFQKII